MLRTRWCLILALILSTSLLTLFQYSMSVAAPAPQDSAQDDGQEYTVRAGDTLSEISRRFYGRSALYRVIVDATNAKGESDPRYSKIVNPSVILVGQRFWIPNIPSEAASESITAGKLPYEPDAATADEITDGSVRFVTPEDGAVVPPRFEVMMAAEGLTVEPAGTIREGAGHFHILVDTDFVPPEELVPFDQSHLHFGQGQMTTTLELEPGPHALRLQFANGAHLALEGEQYRDEITILVK